MGILTVGELREHLNVYEDETPITVLETNGQTTAIQELWFNDDDNQLEIHMK